MKKKLIIFLEIIYNLFLGFWIPTVYQLIKFCIKEINQEKKLQKEEEKNMKVVLMEKIVIVKQKKNNK